MKSALRDDFLWGGAVAANSGPDVVAVAFKAKQE